MRQVMQNGNSEYRQDGGERGSAGTIALVLVVLFIAASLGIITFTYNGMPGRGAQVVPQAALPVPQAAAHGAPAAPASDAASAPKAADNAAQVPAGVPGAQNQTVHINIGSNNAAVNGKKPAGEESSAEEEKAPDPAKKENLAAKYDPNSPNPMLSWTDDEKVKAPVKYYTVVLEYLKKQQEKVQRDRFTLGKQSKIFEQKLKEAKRDVAGNKAMLEKAARIAIEADENDGYPVTFAYSTYDQSEFRLKVSELQREYLKSKDRAAQMQRSSDAMKHVLRVHNKRLEKLESDIRIFAERIELSRAKGLTNLTKESMKKLDEAMRESDQEFENNMRDLEKEVYKDVNLETSEAEMNYADILKKYGPKKK